MEYRENNYGKALILTPTEERRQYAFNLSMILERTRWMLDNLEYFPIYYASFIDYHTGNGHNHWKGQKNGTKLQEGVSKDFNATGWLYNGDCRSVNVGR